MKSSVLFLCTGNSARSQMAEGLLRYFAGNQYEVFSAGTHPAGLNPLAVGAMREIGADISAQRSKHISEFDGVAISVVVTVCDRARESCPIFPMAGRTLHWSFDDPAAVQGSHGERLAEFRRVRDLIAGRIRTEFVSEDASRS